MIARIEIDFTLNEGDDLGSIMNMIGDMVVPALDPHDEGEPCVRFVSVAAYRSVDEEYEDLGFDEDDEEQITSLLAQYRDRSEFN